MIVLRVRAAACSTLYIQYILCTLHLFCRYGAEGVQASKSTETHACGKNCLHSKVDPTVRTYPLVVT